MVATLPGRTQGLGLITEPLLADLRLDRVSYASMNLWATLLGAVVCLPTGWAIDRLGLRWVSLAVLLSLGFTVWQFSLLTSSAAVFILLLATRAFGQSSLSVCSIAAVARWFPNRAGFAMGVYSVLLSVLFAGAFGGIGYAVRVNGWRWAWTQIALGLLVGIAPLAVLVLRKPPPGLAAKGSVSDRPGGLELTLFQALRTRAFWAFAGAAAAFNTVSSGLGLFNEAVLQERGFDQKTFHMFLVVCSLISLAGQLGCGWLTRRYRCQTLTFLALILYAAGLGLIPVITQHWQLWGLALLLGGAGGMIIVVFFSVWSDFFGQRHLGRIQGTAQMITVISSGLGPVLFARCEEVSGSYGPLLWTISIAVFLLAFVARAVPPPGNRDANLKAVG